MRQGKSECEGQMNIFQFLKQKQEKEGYWDAEINQIVTLFEGWAEGLHGIEISSDFRIWDHVPNMGYRLTVEAYIPEEKLTGETFETINSEMNSFKGIEANAYPFKSYKHKGFILIQYFTRFTDERKKRK